MVYSCDLQAQERAEKETREANAMQLQYETAWTNAESSHAQGRQLLDSLTKVSPILVLSMDSCESLNLEL